MTDTLIVIGAGNEPDQYLQQGYERVVLIEPHPRQAESLRQKTADSNAQVEEFAVVTDAALNQLHEFNLPEVSSVRQPTGLKQLMAGLRHRTSHPVATVIPAELCQRYDLTEEGRHKLVIQANGEEVNIVLSLIETGDLARFQQVTLAARQTAYYEGEQTIDAVAGPLQSLGYESRPVGRAHADWPMYECKVNPLQKVVEALRRDLEENEDKNKQIAELQAALSEEAERLKAEQQRSSEATAQTQDLKQKLDSVSELLKSREQKISELNKLLEERDYKVELMRQEVVKVQAQVELIADVLVREKAF